MRLTIVAISFAMTASALADEPQAPPPPAQQSATAQPAAADPDKKICRMMTHEGMLVRTNVCHTQREWDAIRVRQEREVSEFQNRNYLTSNGH